jgi:hypothetical protein
METPMTTITAAAARAMADVQAAWRDRGVDIANRRNMQDRTVAAIILAAPNHGAVACPVFARTGTVDEVHLFRNGGIQASIFKPTSGRLGIWRSDTDQAAANTAEEAVRRALDPMRKRTRKVRQSTENQRVGETRVALEAA